jgi:two-component system response regulator MprA
MKRLLVVDDDADLRETFAELLAQDYDVTTAADGGEALALLSRETFDAVVLDLMMPNVHGEAVLEELARRGSAVPVIIATARSDADEVKVRLGASDFLIKPFSVADLYEKLHAAMGGGDPGAQGPGPSSGQPPTGGGGLTESRAFLLSQNLYARALVKPPYRELAL